MSDNEFRVVVGEWRGSDGADVEETPVRSVEVAAAVVTFWPFVCLRASSFLISIFSLLTQVRSAFSSILSRSLFKPSE